MKILIAIISYNEEKNIETTLRDLEINNFGFDIVVIDNGSNDKTKELLKKHNINYISHCTNTGSAMGTVKSYFMYAYENNYDILCQFDGDGQHLASELNKIIKPIKNKKANYVIGSRFIEKKGFQSSLLRRLTINFFSKIDSIIIKKKITDITSGFRAYDKIVIDFFAKKYKHEIYDTSQLLLLSSFAGAVIEEVSVQMNERKYGKSEFDIYNSITYVLKGLFNIFGCLLQKSMIRK